MALLSMFSELIYIVDIIFGEFMPFHIFGSSGQDLASHKVAAV